MNGGLLGSNATAIGCIVILSEAKDLNLSVLAFNADPEAP